MDMIACAGSFVLGGVSAVLIMGSLSLFIGNSLKKPKGQQISKQIVNNLIRLMEVQKSADPLNSEIPSC